MQLNQILDILKQAPYLTKSNLALPLGKEGNDLNYWIKKLTNEKLLTPLKKGFYISSYYQDTMVRDPGQSEIYWIYLANVLRGPSYVSLEYVLSKYNMIPEMVSNITSVTLKSPRIYRSEKASFIYRNIKRDLFYGYQLLVFGNSGLTAKIAYLFKAIFDFLYLKSFSSEKEMQTYLLEVGRFNWDVLTEADKRKFLQVVKISNSTKMKTITSILKREKVI